MLVSAEHRPATCIVEVRMMYTLDSLMLFVISYTYSELMFFTDLFVLHMFKAYVLYESVYFTVTLNATERSNNKIEQ